MRVGTPLGVKWQSALKPDGGASLDPFGSEEAERALRPEGLDYEGLRRKLAAELRRHHLRARSYPGRGLRFTSLRLTSAHTITL